MADGYCKIYGDGIAAFNDICRYEWTNYHLYGSYTLCNSPLFWTLLGKQRWTKRKKEREKEMNTLIVAGSMVIVAVVGTLFLKYLEHKEEKKQSETAPFWKFEKIPSIMGPGTWHLI